MENASKALIIAGSILIAIIILSVLIYVFGTYRNLAKTQEDTAQQQEIAAFNRQYEAYNKQYLYGAEVITLINKAIDNNLKTNGVTDKNYINIALDPNKSVEEISKTEIFKCTGVSYNDNGRINNITIIKIE